MQKKKKKPAIEEQKSNRNKRHIPNKQKNGKHKSYLVSNTLHVMY